MRLRSHRSLFFVALLVGVTGCASTDEGTDDIYAIDPSAECVRIRQVRNWSAIDDKHVWLEASGRRQFLVTLWARCPGLRFAQVIALKNAGSRICPDDFGSILFDDGGAAMRCQIDNVELVGSRGEAEAIVEDRKALGD